MSATHCGTICCRNEGLTGVLPDMRSTLILTFSLLSACVGDSPQRGIPLDCDAPRQDPTCGGFCAATCLSPEGEQFRCGQVLFDDPTLLPVSPDPLRDVDMICEVDRATYQFIGELGQDGTPHGMLGYLICEHSYRCLIDGVWHRKAGDVHNGFVWVPME